MPSWLKEGIEMTFLGLTAVQRRDVIIGLTILALVVYAAWGFIAYARDTRVNKITTEIKNELVRIEIAAIEASEDAAELAQRLSRENLEATALLRAEIMESQLYNRRIVQCKAADPTLRQAYALQIQTDQSRYHRITGRYHPLPDCAEL